ncbi:hypothetical protein SK128_004333, partial [Halocaridina rubra]
MTTLMPFYCVFQDYYGLKTFVASQGPKVNTTIDFWGMVWENDAHTIVMLTNIVENGREKCFKYWPDAGEGSVMYGDFQIYNHNYEKESLFTISYLEIKKGPKRRLLKHFHFNAWPDFGAPQHEDSLLDFIKTIKFMVPHTRDQPMVVHCSAGVGRTGTFIGLWNLIECFEKELHNSKTDIKKTILDMREDRPSMVQSQDQYLYLCKCIARFMANPNAWNRRNN